MKQKFKTFYDAWWFLTYHPIFWNPDDFNASTVKKADRKYFGRFLDCLDIEVQKVDPRTNRIEDNTKLNTHTRVWLECGGFIFDKWSGANKYVNSHDMDLDCAGDTFEEAIIILANLVWNKFGEGKYATKRTK